MIFGFGPLAQAIIDDRQAAREQVRGPPVLMALKSAAFQGSGSTV